MPLYISWWAPPHWVGKLNHWGSPPLILKVCIAQKGDPLPVMQDMLRFDKTKVHYVCKWNGHSSSSRAILISEEPATQGSCKTMCKCLSPLWQQARIQSRHHPRRQKLWDYTWLFNSSRATLWHVVQIRRTRDNTSIVNDQNVRMKIEKLRHVSRSEAGRGALSSFILLSFKTMPSYEGWATLINSSEYHR